MAALNSVPGRCRVCTPPGWGSRGRPCSAPRSRLGNCTSCQGESKLVTDRWITVQTGYRVAICRLDALVHAATYFISGFKSTCRAYAGWPFSLCKTSGWLQNKSSALAWPALAWPGQSGTFALKSTGGFAQVEWMVALYKAHHSHLNRASQLRSPFCA